MKKYDPATEKPIPSELLVKYPELANGKCYMANTDKGKAVEVWVPNPEVTQDSLKYFCHGFALGTFGNFKYTVLSGLPLQYVLRDEWREITAEEAQRGDIVVWRKNTDVERRSKTTQETSVKTYPLPIHSAIITRKDVSCTLSSHDDIMKANRDGKFTIDSKNGFAELQRNESLHDLCVLYGTTYTFHRPQVPQASPRVGFCEII